MVTGRLWVALAPALALALVGLAACDGGGEAEVPAPPSLVAKPAPSPSAPPPAGDPGVTVAYGIQACREKDTEKLRSFVVGAVSEEEMQALFRRGADVRLVSQRLPELEDGRATVAVRLEVRRDGELDLVERLWELERGADGVWRFVALPDCY